MKHLKSIYLLLEQQLKLFNEYEKGLSDNPKDITMKYLNDRKTKHEKSNNIIGTWDDALAFIDDKKEIKKVVDRLKTYNRVDGSSLLKDMDISVIQEIVIEYLEGITLDNFEDIKDEIESVNNFKSILKVFNKYELNIEDFKITMKDELDTVYVKYEMLLNSTVRNLKNWVMSESGIVYRAMKLPDKIDIMKDKTQYYSGVGKFWTYKEEYAESYRADKEYVDVILVAEVEPIDVFWEKTLYKAYWHLAKELEVVLHEGTTIDIIELKISLNSPYAKSIIKSDYDYLFNVLGLEHRKVVQLTKDKFNYTIELEKPITVRV